MNSLLSLREFLASDDGLMTVASLVAFCTVILVWQALLAPNPMQARLKRLKQRQAALRSN